MNLIEIGLVLAAGVAVLGALATALAPRRVRPLMGGLVTAGVGVGGVLAGIGGIAGTGSNGSGLDSGAWTRVSTGLLPLGEARLTVDALSGVFLLLVGAVAIAAGIYGIGYTADGGHHSEPGRFPHDSSDRPAVCGIDDLRPSIGERHDASRGVGADGAHVAGPRPYRAPPPFIGSRGRALVRRDDSRGAGGDHDWACRVRGSAREESRSTHFAQERRQCRPRLAHSCSCWCSSGSGPRRAWFPCTSGYHEPTPRHPVTCRR